jgi:expansin (peptidoglycan-binding protein)
MTNNTDVTIFAKSDAVGSTIEFFVGSGGTEWGVGNSTYHQGAGIIAELTFTAANVEQEFVIDLAAVSGAEQTWIDYPGKNDIRAIGWRSQTDGATFSIRRVEIGAESTGTISTGGGATCSDGIMNQDETGVDCGGATCSPCSGGTGNGTACTVTTDDGLAEATYYTLLETGASSVVNCSFDAVNDIKGTFYGALETVTLHGSGAAKYCGMCVEMTGPLSTEIVQITDECPDCWEHNTGNTDIDLSTPAFLAIVGPTTIGRTSITWEEVSCPWTNPIHVIVQGSNYDWAKVIIGNHVNRIAKVEMGSGGTFHEMVRGTDNGWVKSGFGGSAVNFIMEVRVTDIYGEEIIVTGIDLGTDPTNSKTDGPSNFPACGLTTSNGRVNSLNYVSIFPNPANNSITLEGLEEVETIQIINLNGQVLLTKVLGGNDSVGSIDISNLASGIYVAKMTGLNNTGTATFVKK